VVVDASQKKVGFRNVLDQFWDFTQNESPKFLMYFMKTFWHKIMIDCRKEPYFMILQPRIFAILRKFRANFDGSGINSSYFPTLMK
jgi:hypothetical protein